MARLWLIPFIWLWAFASDAKGASWMLEAPAPDNMQTTGLIHAPKFARNGPGLVFFKLQNFWPEDGRADLLTFGQAFSKGALLPGEAIAARFGDIELPAQLDVKARHEDGSVRHGVITIVTPALKPDEKIEGALVKTKAAASPDFDPAAMLGDDFSLPVSLRFYFASGATHDDAFDLGPFIQEALGDSSARWLNGPLVKEWRAEIAAAPHLVARIDIRLYRDGDIRASVGFFSEKSFAPGRRDAVYDIRLGEAFTASRVPHHRASNWRRVLWRGAAPKLHVAHDLEGLVGTGAVLPIDAGLGVDAGLIARRDRALRDLPPLSPAFILRDMPAPGGRADIGIYTQWTSHYLVAQTPAAKRVMLAHAEAAGAVPWHFIDDDTGAPISVLDHPRFWADKRGLKTQYGKDRPHAHIFDSSDGGWSPDHSHKPSLSAVAYLVTGDHYYADELAMQGAWALFGRWPEFRHGGMTAVDIEQVRASAWSLRDLSDAAWLLPDVHPSKDYLRRALKENLKMAADKYIIRREMKAAGALEGYFEEFVHGDPERISPWQNDYMALALWLAARRGEEDARRLLLWSANFHTGRFLSPDFNINRAAAYSFPAKDAKTQQPVANWRTLAERMGADQADDGRRAMEGYPGLANGYIGSAVAALSAIADEIASPDALEALARLIRTTKAYPMWRANHDGGAARNNNFLFRIHAPNGASYGRNDITYKSAPGPKGAMIIGNDAINALKGGDGDDLMFGLDGDDDLRGGDGADVISGGRGNDILRGGPGEDLFLFAAIDNGDDVIVDFQPGVDRLLVADRTPRQKRRKEGIYLTFPNRRGGVLIRRNGAQRLDDDNFMIIE